MDTLLECRFDGEFNFAVKLDAPHMQDTSIVLGG
jgi:hypothetical protein